MSNPQRPKPPFVNKLKSGIRSVKDTGKKVVSRINRSLSESPKPPSVTDSVTRNTPQQGAEPSTLSVSHMLIGPSSDSYLTIMAGPSEGVPRGLMLDAVNTGFEGLKTTLRFVERAADVFPPLKSSVAGLLGLIDIVEVRNCHDRS
jgi:hypothetical protein